MDLINVNLYVVGEEGHRKQEHKAYTFPRNIWDLEILSAVSQPNAYFSAASHKYSLVLTRLFHTLSGAGLPQQNKNSMCNRGNIQDIRFLLENK